MNKKPKIKICGITNVNDAKSALLFGADTIGFVFYEKSTRNINFETAGKIITELRECRDIYEREFLDICKSVIVTGVFVNERPDIIKKAVQELGIDIIQLSGTETVEYIEDIGINKEKILKAVRIKDLADIQIAQTYRNKGVNILFDAFLKENNYGGTGLPINIDLLKGLELSATMIAGGIGPENVDEILKKITPYGFDLSSKIEEYPGKKSNIEMAKFFDNLKGVA